MEKTERNNSECIALSTLILTSNNVVLPVTEDKKWLSHTGNQALNSVGIPSIRDFSQQSIAVPETFA